MLLPLDLLEMSCMASFPLFQNSRLKMQMYGRIDYLKLTSTDILNSSTSLFVHLFGGVLVWYLCFFGLVFYFFFLAEK